MQNSTSEADSQWHGITMPSLLSDSFQNGHGPVVAIGGNEFHIVVFQKFHKSLTVGYSPSVFESDIT